MSNSERIKLVSFTAITTLSALLIAVIANHSAFPELLFHSIVIVLIGVIAVFVAYAFLWERGERYVSLMLYRRKNNRLARQYFDDFREFVERFASFGEFSNVSLGITGILEGLIKKTETKRGLMIQDRIKDAGLILQKPLTDLRQKLDGLHWNKKEINYEFLSFLAREFENYVRLHKQLYVNFAVINAREIGLDNIPNTTKRIYTEYKDNYNEFIFAYTEFAKRCSRVRLQIFDPKLPKANEL